MSKTNDEFNGYRKWLGIPENKLPPTHYNLLGMNIDEDDPDVIRAAVEQRKAFIESQRGRGHDTEVTEILYRIGEAEVTLLNSEMRRDYDRSLRLFEKRRRGRRVDPNAPRTTIESSSGRTVGEESGIVKMFVGIMAVVCIGFGTMAWFSFQLPWAKLPKEVEVAQFQPQLQPPVIDKRPETPVVHPELVAPTEIPARVEIPKPVVISKPVGVTSSTIGIAKVEPSKSSEEISLLNDNSLDAWQAPKNGEDISKWSVTDGVLKLKGNGPSLRTKQTFRDFDLHLEFKLPPKCNTGVYLRGRYEVQLLDSEFRKTDGSRATGAQLCGAIYNQSAPSRNVYRGPNKWNTLDVRLVGNLVTVSMNNVVIIDAFTLQGPTSKPLDENESDPGLGPLLMQSHSYPGQEFRNIRIKPIIKH
jgi:hypothetical protein